MKLLKDIFGRKTSIWLSLELVLVTFACWWAFDPVLVSSYVTHLPLGYEPDRLVRFVVTGNNESEEESLLKKVQEMDGVELAYRAHLLPIGFGAEGSLLDGLIHNGDSIQTRRFHFMEGDKIFEVLGIESLTPEVPTSELTRDCERERTVILTRSLAMGLFGTIDVAGRSVKGYFIDWDDDKQTTVWLTKDLLIRAVVEDVRYQTYDRDYATLFYCSSGVNSGIPIILRLREGVNAKRFVQEHQKEIQDEMQTEHCYIRSIQTASEAKDEQSGAIFLERLTRRNLLIAAFFATNREAWLLTTICVIIGCIIYFQFASAKGLFTFGSHSNPAVHFWFDDFGTHFLVVSVIVYIIILCTVLLGTAIPAWRISRSKITESLREE